MILYLIFLHTVFFSVFARDPLQDKTDQTFENECLSSTNGYRAIHHAGDLYVDQSLVEYAQSRCQLISQYDGLSYGHTGLAEGYGENLYWGGNSADVVNPCSAAIDAWYNEVNQYDYSNPGFSSATGHFTQLVWMSTTAVGCARCAGYGGQWYETYVVCDYKPPGNYLDQFADNVLAP